MTEPREIVQGRTGARSKPRTLAESIVNEVADETEDFRDETFDRAKAVGTQVKAAASTAISGAGDLLDTAKGLASGSGEQIKDVIATQKDASADRISGVASAIRNAADDIEIELSFAAPYVRRMADEIDDFAAALKTQSLGEMVGAVEDFARRQPAVFLGIAAAAGFAAVRLLKVPVKSGGAP